MSLFEGFQCGAFQENAFQVKCPSSGDTAKQDRRRIQTIKRAMDDDRDFMDIYKLFPNVRNR